MTTRFDFATSDASTSGVYLVAHEDLAAIDAAASDMAWLVRCVELHECSDRPVLMRRIAAALDAPEGFEHNWPALSDVLRDLSWLPASGYVFLFDHVDGLRNAVKADFDALLDVFDEAGFAWAEREVPFWAFFAMPEDAFDTLDGGDVDG